MGRGSITPQIVESLYGEAMLLADEARSYFEGSYNDRKATMGALEQVELSCESLRVTTRIMHSIAWLLNQKAVIAGELSASQLRAHGRSLADPVVSDEPAVSRLPDEARILVRASQHLYSRVRRLEQSLAGDVGLMVAPDIASPVRMMQARIETAF